MCDGMPGAPPGGLVAEGGRVVGVLLHGVEEQLGQCASAHGRNLTTKVTGDPGTVVPTARRALAVTSTLSGTGPAINRSLTLATVSAVTSVRAVSLVTSVTGPGAVGYAMAYAIGRPASGAATESATRTASESDRESTDRCTVSATRVGGVAETVSAAARARISTGLLNVWPVRASKRPGVLPGCFTTVRPLVLSRTVRTAVSSVDHTNVAATESKRPSSARARGLSVSNASSVSGAMTSMAITRFKPPGPKKPQPRAIATTRTITPARPPRPPRPPRPARWGRPVRAPPPRRRASVPHPRRQGRARLRWRARSTFARPGLWVGAPETPGDAAWRRPDPLA